MLVSFYGKSSPKLVFGEACSKWYGTCCYFVSTFKRRFVYLHVPCLGVLPVCVCAHPACSVHGDQERTSDPLELGGVGTEPRSSARAASALQHWAVSAAWSGVLRWGLTVWPVPAWNLKQSPVDLQRAGMADVQIVPAAWMVLFLVLMFKDVILHWKKKKSLHILKVFPEKQ